MAMVGLAKMAGSAVGQVGIQLALEKALFNKDVKNTTKATESAFSKSFNNIEKTSERKFGSIGGIIKTAFAVVGTGAIASFTKSAINSASETQSAWTGLNSILTGTGKSFEEGKEFIDEYISDGLIPLQNAVTAYKNLASRGYSTEQIEKTMLALKDASAFGRQASYSYGDAIQSATEGLKNENSVLVDNAGVTKNVAKMWEDYAKSIGKSATELTQQEKILAEVNGIVEETKFQMGDASAYADTFSGKVARISTAFTNFKVAVGKFVAPIVELFLPYIEMALNALTRFFNKMAQVLKVFGLEMPDVVSKASTNISNVGASASQTAENISGVGDSATKTAKQIKKAFAGVDEINVLNTANNTGSSNSGSSGNGSGLIGGVGNALDNIEVGEVTESVDNSAVKIANKIKELFEPLKKIDLSNLFNSFDRLKESAEPLTQKLFDGLRWLWDEVLVPFATWSVEDAIPAFFNALAGALDFFNGVIDYAKPYLEWLWEELLQPMASWTGGVIVDVLGWIGDKLSRIGKWLTDNAPTIKEVNKELSPFSDLIKEFAKALGTILGLGWSAFSSVISAVWEYGLKPIWQELLKPIFTSFWGQLKGLAQILGGIFEAFNKLMEGDWKGAGLSIVGGLTDGIKEIWNGSWTKNKLYDPIVNWWKKNKPNLGLSVSNSTTANTVTGWYNNIKKWWGTKKLSVASAFSTTSKTISDWWSNVKKWWGSKKLSISTTFNATKSTVSGWWNKIKGWWGSKTVKIIPQIEAVKDGLKSWLNDKFIKPVNKAIKWTGIKIPKLAQGGWLKANSPQLAIVGDNKKEPEIVTPESKIKEQVIKGIEEMGGSGQTQHFDFTIKLEYPDGKYLIKEINDTQIKDGKISLLV